jgi:hypothetical protein
MARNHNEQVNYLMKVRRGKHGGMSDKDYRIELERLFSLGVDEGMNYDNSLPTDSVRS